MKICTAVVRCASKDILKNSWLPNRLGAIGPDSYDRILNRLNTEDHVIYYIFSPWTKEACIEAVKGSKVFMA